MAPKKRNPEIILTFPQKGRASYLKTSACFHAISCTSLISSDHPIQRLSCSSLVTLARSNLECGCQAPATAIIGGNDGIGFVVGHRAMSEAIERARKVGVGLVAVRNSTYFGASAYYAMMALPHEMIGLAMSSTGPIVFPPGSKACGVDFI